MPVTIKSNLLKVRDNPNSDYISIDAVADQTINERLNDINTTANNAKLAALNLIQTKKDEAVSSINSVSNLQNMLTGIYDSNRPYNVGDYVIFDNLLYKCVKTIEDAGSQIPSSDSVYWTQVVFGNEFQRNIYIPVDWEQGRFTNTSEPTSANAIRTTDYLPIAPGETVRVDYDTSVYDSSRVYLFSAPSTSNSTREFYVFNYNNNGSYQGLLYRNSKTDTQYARFVLSLPEGQTLLPSVGYSAYTIYKLNKNAIITYDMPVTPQLYGAVGDGVADDTAAFQAAINSGYSVYIPTGHNEKYKITSTLNVPNSCKRIFGDVVPAGHYHGGYILFDITGNLGTISDPTNYPLFKFDYNAQAISIAGLYVNSKDNNGSRVGVFLDANTITDNGESLVDKDINLNNLIVTSFNRIAKVAGRGFNAINCNFGSLVRVAEFEWMKSGDKDSNENYPSDYNQRGISFKNCRLHSISGNMITIVSGHVYGFEMIGCVADLGSGKIITAVDEAWNWNISGNVFQGLVAGPSLEFRKGMKNCTISDNIFSADTTMKSTQSTPKNFILIGNTSGNECTTSGCTISGNTFREPSEHHIVIGGTTINGLSISGNAFDQTPEGYNPVRFDQNATNVSFAGNTDTNARPIYSVASEKTVGIYSNSI